MLKKLTVIILCVIFLSLSVGCSDNTSTESDSNTNNKGAGISQNKDSKKIDMTTIVSSSDYSDGLALVKTSTEKDVLYCIDTTGHVVFEVEGNIGILSTFRGSFAEVSVQTEPGKSTRALLDKKGNVTLPTDLGLTRFFTPFGSLENGYILATKIESSYTSAKQELGVLDTSFKWSVPLSTDLYDMFGENLVDSDNFVDKGFFYSAALEKSLNLKTGKISSANLFDVTPSSLWGIPRNGEAYYRVKSGMCVKQDGKYIDFSGKNVAAGSKFSNGVAGILYENETTDAYFVTMIDEKGNNLFEPQQISYSQTTFKIETDGKYLLTFEGASTLVCRDKTGRLLGKYELPPLGPTVRISINEGIIRVEFNSVASVATIFYFDSNLKELF